jgi:hypothetical protein
MFPISGAALANVQEMTRDAQTEIRQPSQKAQAKSSAETAESHCPQKRESKTHPPTERQPPIYELLPSPAFLPPTQ